eukprot:521866-Ditylum_brightwellii.AAC.1
MGFVWSTAHDAQWFNMFEELKKCKQIHGHCSAPLKRPSNKRLANWVSRQRHHYFQMKEGRSATMIAECVDTLCSYRKWKRQ